MLLRVLSIFVLLIILAACGPIDTMKEGFAHCEAVSIELEKSVGLKPFVGFNWNNGSLTSVTVTFQGIPPNVPLPDIAEKSRQAILAEFKQTPERIVISFSVEP